MRLCANENVPSDCVTVLRQRGHVVLWIREVARGGRDDDVLAKAQSEARVLITFSPILQEIVRKFLYGSFPAWPSFETPLLTCARRGSRAFPCTGKKEKILLTEFGDSLV
jgi:hypothetical protein